MSTEQRIKEIELQLKPLIRGKKTLEDKISVLQKEKKELELWLKFGIEVMNNITVTDVEKIGTEK